MCVLTVKSEQMNELQMGRNETLVMYTQVCHLLKGAVTVGETGGLIHDLNVSH